MNDETTIYMPEIAKTPKLYLFYEGEVFETILQGQQRFGRAKKEDALDIIVPVVSVSRQHGLFVTTPGKVNYTDVGSSNGTLYNGRQLESGETVELKDGDILRIHAVKDSACSKDVLLIFATNYENCVWNKCELTDISAINVGREDFNDKFNRAVSRHHATFFKATEGWSIIDRDSKNGVYRNGARISKPEYLQSFDVIKIATYYFIFWNNYLLFQCDLTQKEEMWQKSVVENEQKKEGNVAGSVNDAIKRPVTAVKANASSLSIDIVERSVWKRLKKKILLKDIKMDIPAGSMVLILGGSGAGKTTFMNAVMGYEQANGTIKYNNTDIYEEFERMQYEIGYVPQQDLMRPNDISYETVLNAAQLKLPPNKPREYYETAATKAMEILGLADEKQQLVKSLSGGQRKRLSIAMEYVGNPSLFFLDEPDSGVDNTNSELLLKNLRDIADEGKIVMFISHSPDRTIELVDKIIVLAKDSENDCGRLVFYGDPHDALQFFDVQNLNKIVSRINKKNEGGDGMADYYIKKYENEGENYG